MRIALEKWFSPKQQSIPEPTISKGIEWNTVRYCDCLDSEQGLPSLPSNSFDLCLTDPPYNINFKGYNGYDSDKSSILYYEDHKTPTEYLKWTRNWFSEIKRICSKIIISIGLLNQAMWYQIEQPTDILYNINMTGKFGSRIAVFNKIENWFFYGKASQYFNMNVLFTNLPIQAHTFLHPCPRNEQVVLKIIKGLNPKSVLDPFLGSGTTAEVCTKLGIKWFGYEIEPKYRIDIETRLRGLKPEPKLKQKVL